MYKGKKILAFIGARGGSKGLKNKNIIDFAGGPLIVWSIEAARDSKYVDRTIVSTDSEEIAKVSRQAGADVPFLRPARIAQDDSKIEDAIEHALAWIRKNEGVTYEYIMLLQPTSPLRTVEHVDAAIEHYFKHKKSSGDVLVSVSHLPAKIGWLMRKDKKGYVQFCIKEAKAQYRRQDIPEYYMPNGAIYLLSIKDLAKKGFFPKCTIPFVMEQEVSVDIDSAEDLQRAMDIFKKRKEKSVIYT